MNKKAIIGILVVLAVAAVIVVVAKNGTGNSVSNQNPQNAANNAGISSGASMSFANSPYYPYSYLISGSALSPEAQQAITGFQLTHSPNSNGSVTYTLTAVQAGYVNQSYILQQGQKLYFIERSLGDDDTSGNADYNFGDDFAVIVDSNGNIAQQQ